MSAHKCLVAALCVTLLLAGCATRPPSAAAPPVLVDAQAIAAAAQDQATRAEWLLARPQWSFEGRVAISNAGKGGSGRIDWRQQGPGYEVALSAPVTRQSWRLVGDSDTGSGRLEGLEGGVREGSDAEALLRGATGWEIPVNALSAWARGLPASGFPLDAISYSVEGRLQAIEQAGWRIEYTQWSDPRDGQPSLPRRIEARRDLAAVRLIVDGWQFESR